MTRLEQQIERRRKNYQNMVKDYNVTYEIKENVVCFIVKDKNDCFITELNHKIVNGKLD